LDFRARLDRRAKNDQHGPEQRHDGPSSASVAMQEREIAQNHAEYIKSNSCDQADWHTNRMAYPDRGNRAGQDRDQHGKVDRDIVDDIVGLALYSEEGEFEGRL
jgi:hypothetical protein